MNKTAKLYSKKLTESMADKRSNNAKRKQSTSGVTLASSWRLRETPYQDINRIRRNILAIKEAKDVLKSEEYFKDPSFTSDITSLAYVYSGDDKYEKAVFRRPHEMTSDPVLVGVGGVCDEPFPWRHWKQRHWLHAAFVAVSLSIRHLEKIIPGYKHFEQGFFNDYTGAFHFNIWRFGEWVDVVVDDRLPMLEDRHFFCGPLGSRKELWGPLVEKAYAKCKRTYQSIEFGNTLDALTDLTGAVCEYYSPDVRPPRNLFRILVKSHAARSQMVCWRNEKRLTPSGFCADDQHLENMDERYLHVITAVTKFPLTDGRIIEMLRLKCPFPAEPKWNGRFSDKDYGAWETVNREFMHRFQPVTKKEDDEYWISTEDFRCNFGGLIIISCLEPYRPEGLGLQRSYHLKECWDYPGLVTSDLLPSPTTSPYPGTTSPVAGARFFRRSSTPRPEDWAVGGLLDHDSLELARRRTSHASIFASPHTARQRFPLHPLTQRSSEEAAEEEEEKASEKDVLFVKTQGPLGKAKAKARKSLSDSGVLEDAGSEPASPKRSFFFRTMLPSSPQHQQQKAQRRHQQEHQQQHQEEHQQQEQHQGSPQKAKAGRTKSSELQRLVLAHSEAKRAGPTFRQVIQSGLANVKLLTFGDGSCQHHKADGQDAAPHLTGTSGTGSQPLLAKPHPTLRGTVSDGSAPGERPSISTITTSPKRTDMLGKLSPSCFHGLIMKTSGPHRRTSSSDDPPPPTPPSTPSTLRFPAGPKSPARAGTTAPAKTTATPGGQRGRRAPKSPSPSCGRGEGEEGGRRSSPNTPSPRTSQKGLASSVTANRSPRPSPSRAPRGAARSSPKFTRGEKTLRSPKTSPGKSRQPCSPASSMSRRPQPTAGVATIVEASPQRMSPKMSPKQRHTRSPNPSKSLAGNSLLPSAASTQTKPASSGLITIGSSLTPPPFKPPKSPKPYHHHVNRSRRAVSPSLGRTSESSDTSSCEPLMTSPDVFSVAVARPLQAAVGEVTLFIQPPGAQEASPRQEPEQAEEERLRQPAGSRAGAVGSGLGRMESGDGGRKGREGVPGDLVISISISPSAEHSSSSTSPAAAVQKSGFATSTASHRDRFATPLSSHSRSESDTEPPSSGGLTENGYPVVQATETGSARVPRGKTHPQVSSISSSSSISSRSHLQYSLQLSPATIHLQGSTVDSSSTEQPENSGLDLPNRHPSGVEEEFDGAGAAAGMRFAVGRPTAGSRSPSELGAISPSSVCSIYGSSSTTPKSPRTPLTPSSAVLTPTSLTSSSSNGGDGGKLECPGDVAGADRGMAGQGEATLFVLSHPPQLPPPRSTPSPSTPCPPPPPPSPSVVLTSTGQAQNFPSLAGPDQVVVPLTAEALISGPPAGTLSSGGAGSHQDTQSAIRKALRSVSSTSDTDSTHSSSEVFLHFRHPPQGPAAAAGDRRRDGVAADKPGHGGKGDMMEVEEVGEEGEGPEEELMGKDRGFLLPFSSSSSSSGDGRRPHTAPQPSLAHHVSSGSLSSLTQGHFRATKADYFRSEGRWRLLLEIIDKWSPAKKSACPSNLDAHSKSQRHHFHVARLQYPDEISPPTLQTKRHVIVSLLQDYRHGALTANSLLVPIGFCLYRCKGAERDDKRHISRFQLVEQVLGEPEVREVTARFDLDPGYYFLVPFYRCESHVGEYLLRVMTEDSPHIKTGCRVS